MKKKKIALIVGGIVVVAVAVLFINGRNAAGNMPVNQTMVENVKRDTITNTVTAKGEVSLLNTELIYSTTVAEVEEVLVEKNDMVKAGDVLVRYTEKSRETIENKIRDAELNLRSVQISLADARTPNSETAIESSRLGVTQSEQDIKNLEMSISTQKNEIEKAKIKISDAEKTLSDNKALFELGAVSKEALDGYEKSLRDAKDTLTSLENALAKDEMNLDSAKDTLSYKEKVYEETKSKTSTTDVKNLIAQRQIAVEQAQINLEDAKKELADYQHEIISPISGTVSMVNISKGEMASTEKALMEISNVDDYVVKVDVNERNAAKIALGQEAQITGAVLGKESVYGKITKIGSIAEQKQTSNGTERVVPVEITVEPSELSKVLKPGFSLEAKITTEVKENIVVLPLLSIMKDKDGNSYVFILKEDNTVEKRVIEQGLYADMYVEATGIEEGETVVSQPTADMVDGMAITPLNIDEMAEEGAPEGGLGQ
ncbi:efflux RND transporter periplasmic adaptor subunit [Tyzzerella sp. OttesenSCG-928-J15]|nr:efflux RND transporter periplasmic adaptor subunit [Tyzzerella sp. OttesenSCG-928-J15]